MPANSLKRLVTDTAVYGLSNMVGRLLNYLLVPLYTRVLAPDQNGIATKLYAWVALLMVLYLYGMETAYFRFINKPNADQNKVYSTAFASLAGSSLLLSGIIIGFSPQIAEFLQVLPQYVIWLACIMAFDALVALPFCRLRQEQKPLLFASLKILNIALNIFLNIWLLTTWIPKPFHSEVSVSYIFLANLVANGITLLIMAQYFPLKNFAFHPKLLRQMLVYALPLVLVGLLGMLNEMFSRIVYQNLAIISQDAAQIQLGIFGNAIKISVFMSLFTQTFRMGAEPFFFKKAQDKNAPETYAKLMRVFVAMGSVFFVFVSVFLQNKGCCQSYSLGGFIIGTRFAAYYEGLKIVPILFLSYLLSGIYYNLSVWYRLQDRTHVGVYLAVVGALVTVAGNLLAIPKFGYVGAAWVSLVSSGVMVVLSYVFGQKTYPVPYPVWRILAYIFGAVGVYFLQEKILLEALVSKMYLLYAIKIAFVATYTLFVFRAEKKLFFAPKTEPITGSVPDPNRL